jgi:hypothetical protein
MRESAENVSRIKSGAEAGDARALHEEFQIDLIALINLIKSQYKKIQIT